MEYNDAIRYLMEGAYEEQAEKESSYDEEYEKDYEELTGLEADLKVFEEKIKDSSKTKQQEDEEFERMIKRLAELQIEKDELNSLSWKKICSVFSGKYEKRRADLDNDSLFAQVEMNSIKMNLQNIAQKIELCKKAKWETKKAFNAKRAYMKERYGADHRYESEIEHRNTKLQAIVKEIDEAVNEINKMMGHGEKAFDSMDSMDTWDMVADNISALSFVGMMVGESIAASREADARDRMFLINSMLPLVVKEVEDVIQAYSQYRAVYEDEDPENELENKEDMDPPMQFVKANIWAVKDKRIYTPDALGNVLEKMNVIKNYLSRERAIVKKMIKK